MNSRNLILVVEDCEDDRFLFRQAARRAGLRNPVRFLEDGLEAIGYLSGIFFYADRDRFPLPKILVLDAKLPRKTGWEVLEWVRSRAEFADILVVVLTASEIISDLQKAYRMGANSFLLKPCQPEELIHIAQAFPAHFGRTQKKAELASQSGEGI
jgi:CheY-like chemotaxis protein